jgi:hypothetical protein
MSAIKYSVSGMARSAVERRRPRGLRNLATAKSFNRDLSTLEHSLILDADERRQLFVSRFLTKCSIEGDPRSGT